MVTVWIRSRVNGVSDFVFDKGFSENQSNAYMNTHTSINIYIYLYSYFYKNPQGQLSSIGK